MSSDRDTTRIVRSWLDEGVTELPDRVLDAVLDQVPATRQRRAMPWPARRLSTMNMYAKLGLIAAAVALVAVVGYSYLFGAGGFGSPEPTQTPIPTATPGPEAAILTGANVGQTLDPGTYRVEGLFPLPFSFTIESNWILEYLTTDTVSLNRAEDPGADWLDIQLIENVMSDPCAGELSDPPVAKNPADLIAALAGMPGFEAGSITEVTVGDHAGSHVFVTNEMDGDALGCAGGNGIGIYTTVDLPDPSITNGNSRDEFWVVDVDATPIVLHGLITRFSDEEADVLETQQIVETITFD